jgi:fermentation-respiration switch protein FrsA (DUF1100 family)
LDMDAAVAESVRRGVPPSRTIFFGESLGGAVVLEAATRHPCAGVVVESSFTSISDVGRLYYPWLPVRMLLTIRYDSASRAAGLRCPKLFLHSPEDDVIPYSMGRRLYELAAEPKAFADLRGGHNDGGITASPAAQDALSRWLDDVLGPPEAPAGRVKGARP